MPEFDANKEAAALTTILQVSDTQRVSTSGNVTAGKFLEDAHKEFCKLDSTESKLTIEALGKMKEISVLKNGRDQPIGASIMNGYGTKTVYLSFDCPFK